jgi:hypothetical protein
MNSVVFAKRKNISSKKKPITKMKITLSEELNRLTAIDGHDRQYFYELRARLVSLRIFVRY